MFGRGNDGGVFYVFYCFLEQIAKLKFTMNKANREIRLISLMHVSVTLQSAPPAKAPDTYSLPHGQQFRELYLAVYIRCLLIKKQKLQMG